MKTKTTLSITEARRKIYDIADKAQSAEKFFTLTERGVPKIVVLSAQKFSSLMEKKKGAMMMADARRESSDRPQFFPKTLIIRDESRIVYLSDRDQDLKHKQEEELIKAQLYVEIIEKYHYPLGLVEFGRYVKVGPKESKRYIEADLIINDLRGNVRFIFEVSSFAFFEKNLDQMAQDLFEISDSVSWAKKPEQLFCFSRKIGKNGVQVKIAGIDCRKFNTFHAWKKSGRPVSKEIPVFLVD
jgi:prevent-host-death family protein